MQKTSIDGRWEDSFRFRDHSAFHLCPSWRLQQVGEAEIHLQEDNRVSLSQGVYTLYIAESGQVERVQPLSRHTCMNVDMCLCSRSNLEGAGGCSLFDVINSLCSLLASRREPVNILPHAPLFIFHVPVTASVLWAHPIWSSLGVITVAYDVNEAVCHAFTILMLNWKKKKLPDSKTTNMLLFWKCRKCHLCHYARFPFKKKRKKTQSQGLWAVKTLTKEMEREGKISSTVWSECK